MESALERQSIRAAVALAAASAHGQTPEMIADLRDEAVQLINLCLHPAGSPDELRAWCDDAATLIQRCATDGSIPEEALLTVSTAVLRLRLAATRAATAESERSDEKSRSAPPAKKQNSEEPKPAPIELAENQQKVVAYIKEHPGVRTKELIASLAGTFSSRTIKRYLAELSSLKILHRKTLPDGGVSWT